MTGQTLLLVLHITGNLLWIGGIAGVAATLGMAGAAGVRKPVALRIYQRVAVPGFIASLIGGGAVLFMNPALYFSQTRWMHPKLTLVLVVIALHHVLGARAKRLSDDGATKGANSMGAVLVICAVGAAFLALAKPF
jgi:putative membrane protein